MSPILRNILAVLAGLVIGGSVNMALIMVSGDVIPPPPGANLTTAEGLQAAMPLMRPIHFLMPFLAHALGTLFGAGVAGFIARNMRPALVVGGFFLLGGIMAVMQIPAPIWFDITDLTLAYLPMAWAGWKVSSFIK